MLAVTLLAGARAWAGEGETLMVAAEVEPELGLDARDVRAAVGAELHRPVAAPAAELRVDTEDVLLVSISRKRTVVSFRAANHESAARAIPTPADRASRLRAVAWLAGNLGRDQISPLVLSSALASNGDGATAAETKVITAPALTRSEEQPSSDTPSIVPPPVASPEPLQIRATPTAGSGEGTWSILVAGGLAFSYGDIRFARSGGPSLLEDTKAYHLELQHRQAEGWLLGGAIDYGPTPTYGAAYAVTAGLAQRWERFHFEESVGLGFGRGFTHTMNTAVTSSSVTGVSSATTRSTSTDGQLYARAFVRASLPIWRSWSLVANLGVRGSPFDQLDEMLMEGTVGAGFELP